MGEVPLFASDIVLAWRKAARAWIRSQGVNGSTANLMREACDRIDVDSNDKISMFEFHEVCRLFNGTKEANQLQKKMATLAPSKQKCGNSDAIFKMMDGDGNNWLSKVECFVGLHWLKDQLRLVGPPKVIVANFDANVDGKLSKSEFDHLGKMLTPQLDKPRMEALFKQLDVDPKDNFVTEGELRFEEECAHPFGCGDNVEPSRIDTTSSDLKKYYHVPAIVQGRVTISLELSKVLIAKPPPENKLAEIVGQQFAAAFSKIMNVTATVQSSTTFHKGHGVQPLEDDMRTRMVVVSFEVDVEDGGGFQELLERSSDKINTQCLRNVAIADMEHTWMQGAKANMWGRLTASYYSKALPDGMTLYQDFGQMPGQKLPLWAAPYTYAVKYQDH